MYLEYFGFREQPFNVTPDPRFFYSNTGYLETYAGLLYGIRERKGFLSLIGEVGTGKTTILRKVMSELKEPIHSVYLCYPTLSFDELLGYICTDLGLPDEEKGRLQKIRVLNDFLLDVAAQGGTGVLFVDEAQNLDDAVLENLRLLSNLETLSEKLLQIVLVGQPELEKKLAQPQLRQLKQRITVHGRLGRLKDREVGPFILNRLVAVGYARTDLFSPDAIQRIAEYAKGTPRLINIICDNSLLVAYSLNRTAIAVDIVDEVARDLQLRIESPAVRGLELAEKPRKRIGNQTVLAVEKTPEPPPVREMRPLPRLASPQTTLSPPERLPVRELRLPSKRAFHIIVGMTLALILLGGIGMVKFFGQEAFGILGTPNNKSDTSPATESALVSQLPGTNPVGTPGSPVASEARPAPLGRDRSIILETAMSILAVVSKNYRTTNMLVVDLVCEHNPHLRNIERVGKGEQVWLPLLSFDALVRVQPNQQYRLILASFRSQREAARLTRTVAASGYSVTVTPRPIAPNLTLHRVEVENLQSLDEVKTVGNRFPTHTRLFIQSTDTENELSVAGRLP